MLVLRSGVSRPVVADAGRRADFTLYAMTRLLNAACCRFA